METEDEFKKYQITKNRPKPVHKGWAKVADKWDRFAVKLDAGDELRMDKTEANSFSNRAKKMGFVVVTRKRDLTEQEVIDGVGEYLVWFGGRKK